MKHFRTAMAVSLILLLACLSAGCGGGSEPADGAEGDPAQEEGVDAADGDAMTDPPGDDGVNDPAADAPFDEGADGADGSEGDAVQDVASDDGLVAFECDGIDSVLAETMVVISRGVPAYASSSSYPASNANDDDYNTPWRSSGAVSESSPAWLAYDLSGVPAAQRQRVLVAWYNTANYFYDYMIFGPATSYNLPEDYRIEGNAAAGGSPPADGWVTLATASGNTYHSRQHAVDLSGFAWIRILITRIAGSEGNSDAAIDMDVHDASTTGYEDSWIFFGDSITANAMGPGDSGASGLGSFGQLVNAGNSSYFPAAENGGIGFFKAVDALDHIDAWLAIFPGKYVCLSYGTNDVNGNPAGVDESFSSFRVLVQKILDACKVPCIPHMPWAPEAGVQANAPALNARIDELYTEFPEIIHGPDLYTLFEGRNDLFADGLHPNGEGNRLLRETWAQTMLDAVYR